MSEDVMESKPATPVKTAKPMKLKLNLTIEEDHPFFGFLNEVKERKIQELDPADFILEVFANLDGDFWNHELEKRTPLEYKLQQALTNPEMREKLSVILQKEVKH
jgi:hypothetical protein